MKIEIFKKIQMVIRTTCVVPNSESIMYLEHEFYEVVRFLALQIPIFMKK